MWRDRRLLLNVLALVGLIVLAAGPVGAQTGGGYDLGWNTIDGGGGMSNGGGYALSGSIGQPDAHPAAGEGYALRGGFWGAWAEAGGLAIYLPFVRR